MVILLQNGFPPDGDAIYEAISPGNRDLIALLFEYGADARSIPFEEVVACNEKELIQLFIDKGADIETGYPLVDGFLRAPRLFCGVYKTNIDKFPNLKIQAEIALRRFCEDKRMQGICLMLWLGADPRRQVPYDAADDEPEFWDTSLSIAIRTGNLEAVKKMKPNRERDDLDAEMQRACYSGKREMLRYLVKRGADPNWQGPDGENAVRAAFWHLEMVLDCQSYYLRSNSRIEEAKGCLFELIELGAKWEPKESRDFNIARKSFYRLTWPQIAEILETFQKREFCSEEALVRLFNAPKIKKELQPHWRELARMLPWFEKWIPKPAKHQPERRKHPPRSPGGIPITKSQLPAKPPRSIEDSNLVQRLKP